MGTICSIEFGGDPASRAEALRVMGDLLATGRQFSVVPQWDVIDGRLQAGPGFWLSYPAAPTHEAPAKEPA